MTIGRARYSYCRSEHYYGSISAGCGADRSTPRLFPHHIFPLARDGQALAVEWRECEFRLVEIGELPLDLTQEAVPDRAELMARRNLDRDVYDVRFLMDEVRANLRRQRIEHIYDDLAVNLDGAPSL